MEEPAVEQVGARLPEPPGADAPVPPPADPRRRKVAERSTEAMAKAKARGEELLAAAEARRPRSAVIDVAIRSIEHDAEVGGGIMAGAVAFRIFLFFVPFVFFFITVFGLIADAFNRQPRELASDTGIAGLLADSITTVGDQSFWSRLTILVVSGFALVLGSRSLIKVLHLVHLLIWRLPRARPRNRVKATGGLILALLLNLIIVQLLNRLENRSFAGWVVGTALYMVFPAALWLLASLKLFPHPPEADWRDLLPGALLVGVGVEALSIFTVVWISHSFESKSETYGAIGGSLSLLLWAYVLGRIIAAAPVVNAMMWRRGHPAVPPLFPPPIAGVLSRPPAPPPPPPP
jgi:uncharacterized BrkB/YihY/UPF0761 family membrane protein